MAIAAALVLLLQVVLSGWSAAAAPRGALLDTWGNPICLAGGHGMPADAPDGAADCCALRCGAAAPQFSAPSVVVPFVHRPRREAAIRYPAHDPGAPARRAGGGGGARGPPPPG